MIGSSIPCFANEMLICRDCGRNLGDRYSRLKGKKQPDVVKIDGKHYCSKCADKHYGKVENSARREPYPGKTKRR